jgi:hypothetical protein
MRFVATKTPEQQSCLMLDRAPSVHSPADRGNQCNPPPSGRAGSSPVGRNGVEELLGVVADPDDKRVPEVARACLAALGAQLVLIRILSEADMYPSTRAEPLAIRISTPPTEPPRASGYRGNLVTR